MGISVIAQITNNVMIDSTSKCFYIVKSETTKKFTWIRRAWPDNKAKTAAQIGTSNGLKNEHNYFNFKKNV